MMVEVFKYTERVVNMIRPRKLLFMAIGEFYCRYVGFKGLNIPIQMVLHLVRR